MAFAISAAASPAPEQADNTTSGAGQAGEFVTDDELRRLPKGKHRMPCDRCAKGERDKAMSVRIDSAGGVWQCFRCGAVGGWGNDYLQTFRPAKPYAKSTTDLNLTLAANYRQLWRDAEPISGIAAEYLTARACAIPPADGDLRYVSNLRHPSGYSGPALLALVTDAVTREPLTLHRTWICADGKKADIDPPRLLLGKHRKKDGVIRLWPDDSVTTALAVGEGIESVLTVAHVYTPVWSLVDAGNLAAFPVIDGIDNLLIAADNDAAGIRAAERCAERWYRAGRAVRIAKSPIPGQDLNDYIRHQAAA